MGTMKDVNGKDSSKRLWASRYLFAGLFMALIYFFAGLILSILEIKMEFDFPHEIWYGIVGGGFASLGMTVFESKVK